MNYLKKYSKFFEDESSNANVSGMGDVVSAQPGSLPGTFGTDGSGDIGYHFKKNKRKKGKVSEVSDLRDLEIAKTNKISESVDDVMDELLTYLKSNNYSPLQINQIIDSYYDRVRQLSDEGNNNSVILSEIIGLLPDTIDDKFLSFGSPAPTSGNISFL